MPKLLPRKNGIPESLKSRTLETNGNVPVIPNGKEAKIKVENVKITPPDIREVQLRLVGTASLVINKFSEKAQQMIRDKQEAGSRSTKGKKLEPKDFEECFELARHRSVEGWDGIHAMGFKNAMVEVCTIAGFHMTKAKKTLFVVADGHDEQGTALVKITKNGEPRMDVRPVRNANGGADLRARPMYDEGWECVLTVRYDADMFSITEIHNLLARVGAQCGIGEGRPNSPNSCGCDWGTFQIEQM